MEKKRKPVRKYEVEPFASGDYGVVGSNGQLMVVCNTEHNAELIAAILEADLNVQEAPANIEDVSQEPYRVKKALNVKSKIIPDKVYLCRDFQAGDIVRHFKGNLYEIKSIGKHTETGQEMVVYQALYGERQTFVRPFSVFTERVDREKYPDAGQTYRFEIVEFTDMTK